MPLQKIVAHLECDGCGERFTSKIPNDANADEKATIFEIVTEWMGEQALAEGSKTYDVGFYNDGEFFGPCCAKEKIEEAWVEDIKNGKVTRQTLEDLGELEKYERYLPRPQLEAAT